MKKIPTLFQRNHAGDRRVRNEITPGCEWVLQGEGVATRKLDGTCCMVQSGALYKRVTVKKNKRPPQGFIPATDVDPNTGKQFGWVLVGDGPGDQWHREAWHATGCWLPDGTYELIGPKVNGNNEGVQRHRLERHATFRLCHVPRDFDGLREYLARWHIEGVVWHHPDGRMAKVKARDFGIPWPRRKENTQ